MRGSLGRTLFIENPSRYGANAWAALTTAP
jgi:hypothetical protein